MISTDRLYAAGLAARLSLRDYLAVYTPRIYLTTTLPRAVLQVAFLAYLGYYAGGEDGRKFAFVGACMHVIVLATVVRGPNTLIDDRWQGTLHRLRLSVVPPTPLVAVRWWIFVAEGTIDALVAAIIVGPVIGETEAALWLLAAAPLFLLVAFTTSALGLVVAAFALTQRADVLITNFVSYLLIVACGVVAPLAAFGDLGETVVRALPLTNGLLAVRAVVEGEHWADYAALETVVGTAWLAFGVVLFQLQFARVRARGAEEHL